jgi:hypothetical protein
MMVKMMNDDEWNDEKKMTIFDNIIIRYYQITTLAIRLSHLKSNSRVILWHTFSAKRMKKWEKKIKNFHGIFALNTILKPATHVTTRGSTSLAIHKASIALEAVFQFPTYFTRQGTCLPYSAVPAFNITNHEDLYYINCWHISTCKICGLHSRKCWHFANFVEDSCNRLAFVIFAGAVKEFRVPVVENFAKHNIINKNLETNYSHWGNES